MDFTTVDQFQKNRPVFSYDSFEFAFTDNALSCTFHFSCAAEHFTALTSIYGVGREMGKRIGHDRLSQWVFHLGLAEIPTYWKAFTSPIIEINCGFLNQNQVKFWQKLLYKGMGEFFYVNQIKPFGPEIKSNTLPRRQAGKYQIPNSNKILVPVGGGKDSIVTLELLATAGHQVTTFSSHQGASPGVIRHFSDKYTETRDIRFERQIDPHLLELNSLGATNGHTPFSALLAFLSVCAADLLGIPFVALSNEGSANEPTLTWNGIDVNHQYSKSFEFEQDFQNYIHYEFGTSMPSYFSLLRPFYELQIVKFFTAHKDYFHIFHSCNVGQKTNSWCGNCSKCVFVALTLSAFIDDSELELIFHRNIFTNKKLKKFTDQLIGQVSSKPFECVGTRIESQIALYLALERRKSQKLPPLLGEYKTWFIEQASSLSTLSTVLLHSFGDKHAIPSEFLELVKEDYGS